MPRTLERVIRSVVRRLCGAGAVLIEQNPVLPWDGVCVYNDGRVERVRGAHEDDLYLTYLEDLKKALEEAGLKGTDYYKEVVKRMEDVTFSWENYHRTYRVRQYYE